MQNCLEKETLKSYTTFIAQNKSSPPTPSPPSINKIRYYYYQKNLTFIWYNFCNALLFAASHFTLTYLLKIHTYKYLHIRDHLVVSLAVPCLLYCQGLHCQCCHYNAIPMLSLPRRPLWWHDDRFQTGPEFIDLRN